MNCLCLWRTLTTIAPPSGEFHKNTGSSPSMSIRKAESDPRLAAVCSSGLDPCHCLKPSFLTLRLPHETEADHWSGWFYLVQCNCN